jgi:branched-chain amino acid transport system permease protein
VIGDYLFFTGLNILLAWSVYVILLSGVMSFGNGAFMAVGAYIAGICTVKFGVPLEAALVIAALSCVVIGVLVGFPALRTRGLYLIMVTIGFAFCIRVAAENIAYIGGVRGLRGLYGTTLWQVYGAIAVVGAGLWIIARSPLQRILDATREDEAVAAAIGINTVYIQLAAFAAGAGLAGFAGALYGHYMAFIAPDHFNILVSINIVLFVIFGGVNNMWGPVLGATIMTLLPEFVRVLAEWRTAFFSLVLLLLLLVRPDGLLSFRSLTARAASRWPVRAPATADERR